MSEVPAHEQANANTSRLARAQRFEDAERRRNEELACADHFLRTAWPGHAAKCLFFREGEPVCSRDYDPGPITPEEEAFYEGTGIGALYGLDGSDRFAADLAGWTVRYQGDDVNGASPFEVDV